MKTCNETTTPMPKTNPSLSRRQELDNYVSSGDLRYHLQGRSGGLSDAALDLLIDIASRYCQPRRRRRPRSGK